MGERYVELDRPMLRPDVSIKKTLALLLFYEIVLVAISLLIASGLKKLFSIGLAYIWVAVLVNFILSVAFIILTLKNVIIKTVLIYQRYASYSVRERCTMIPSCSEYMILAVKKYGAVKGLFKGIGRLRRCGKACEHIEDWP